MKILKKEYPDKKMIKIRKIIKTSMIDWDGMIISTLYVGGCNFRCPFCYNTDLVLKPRSLPVIPMEKVMSFICTRRSFLDGICLSGGEPTLNDDLPEFLKKIKNLHMMIKLDTNGSQTEKLRAVIDNGLVDYIAMDIKNCLQVESYTRTIGIQEPLMISRIKNSIDLIMHSGIEYEFRTTVVPGFHNSGRIEDLAKDIKGAKRYVLQHFVQSAEMLNPYLKDVKPFCEEEMLEMKRRAEPFVQNCKLR